MSSRKWGRWAAGLASATLVLAVAGAPTGASSHGTAPAAAAAEPNVYVVVLVEDPVASYEGGRPGFPRTAPRRGQHIDTDSRAVRRYARFLDNRHNAVLGNAGAPAGAKFYDYRYSLNGFAAELTAVQADRLRRTRGVLAVQRDELRQKTTDNTPAFLGISDEGGLWDQTGGVDAAGEDVIVGVIDTGIWPEHPSFSDQSDFADRPGKSGNAQRVYGPPPEHWNGTCQAGEKWSKNDCNNKLIGARYFLDGFTRHGLVIDEYGSARDADGHGTHTASTAAGNNDVGASIFDRSFGTVSGMAPRARVAAYKALWNDQGGFASDLAAAIDAAVADGVDVINYSIGSSTPGFTGADDIAFLLAARAGVFVANSAGNSGPGAATIGSPAAAPWLTTVGASTQNRTFESTATLGSGAEVTGASLTPGTGGSFPLVDAADAAAGAADAESAELCLPGTLDPAAVSGAVVLCKRGVNARVEKSEVVADAGGVGMILYNPDDSMALVTDNHFLPSVHVNFTDGSTVKSYIAAAGDGATASLSDSERVDAQGSVMADFSSRGPNGASGDLIKPDVTAPGVNILAGASPTPFLSKPGQLFQAISGTSMSSPHTAGLGALLVDLHPDWTPAMIKSALTTTGRQDVTKEDGTTPADPFDIGGGHVVPNSAADPGLAFDTTFEDYVAFLCGAAPQIVNPAFCDGLADAGFSFDASDLNIPSIGIDALVSSQTVTRTVTSVADAPGTWTASVEGLDGYDVTVPDAFTLQPGASHSFDLTFTRTTAQPDEWVFGAVVFSDGIHTVRTVVALQASDLDAPTLVAPGDPVAESGELTWEATVGFDGALSATAHGLVADTVTPGLEVAQDPDQDISTGTLTSGVNTFEFDLTGVEYFAGGTRAATTEAGSDLDVFLLHDADADGFTIDDLVTFSADGDSEEIVEVVDPDPGQWLLIVHGWGTPDGASSFDLHEWVVTPPGDGAGFEAHVGAGDPAVVSSGETVVVTTGFADLTATATEYRGVVVYDDGTGRVGTTVVKLTR